MARVDRLRGYLLAGTVLLLLVLVGAMGYSRYRAGRGWLRKLVKHSGASLIRETDGFTYSQSVGGRTVFTLHAARAFQHEGGLWTLHDVIVTVYESGGRADKIYGNEFEWDEGKGIARAMGETTMDLQMTVPKGPQPGTGQAAVPTDGMMHVKTSGLVFLRKLGVGATTEPVEFVYAGLRCTSRGAEFDTAPSELHLLADVHIDGVLQGEPVSLRAARADLSRNDGIAAFVQPVVTAGARRGRAQNAVLHLRDHGELERAEATGDVVLDEGTRELTSARADAAFGAANRAQSAYFSGGVALADSSALRPLNGTAADMRLRFDGEGRLAGGIASGGAYAVATQPVAGGARLVRELRGATVEAVMVPVSAKDSALRSLHLAGGASLRGDSPATGGLQTTSMAGDDLTASFLPASGSKAQALGAPKGAAEAAICPDTIHGRGHTELRQTGAGGLERVSTGETLDVRFAAGSGPEAGRTEVASATQDGHVAFRSRTPAKAAAAAGPGGGAQGKPDDVASGSADHAAYDGASESLTLTGGAHLVDAGNSVTAATVVVHQATGDAEARGNVVATMGGQAGAGQAGAGQAAARPATHVSAAHAVLHHAADIAEFDAGDGRPARLWQEASQVEANRIVLDGKAHTLVATPSVVGVVRSVFAGAVAGGKKEAAAAGSSSAATSSEPRVLRVESHELSYTEASREAVFAGPVVMSGTGEEVKAKRAVATFAPAAVGAASAASGGLPAGSLERVVATGDVRLAEPGRQGSGEQLTYTARDGSLLLTGTAAAPPRVTDAQQGTVTGASLLLRPGESTIVVTGGAATDGAGAGVGGGAKPPRARVETKVRQQGK